MRSTRATTMVAAVVLLGTSAILTCPASAALDCARVKELTAQGSSPADVARALGITTPDVQACLADAVEEPVMANPAGKLPLTTQRPVVDAPIRRAPAGQIE